jgi:hypothetical protein
VVGQALTALALSGARLIGASALDSIGFKIAFHSLKPLSKGYLLEKLRGVKPLQSLYLPSPFQGLTSNVILRSGATKNL